jgi:hypothetical protein
VVRNNSFWTCCAVALHSKAGKTGTTLVHDNRHDPVYAGDRRWILCAKGIGGARLRVCPFPASESFSATIRRLKSENSQTVAPRVSKRNINEQKISSELISGIGD